MSMLYLWHPAVGNDGTMLDLIITRGDSDQVGGGSERFVSAAVESLGIDAMPEKWSIRPFRCNFYSEYWTEEGWTSKWDFAWRMTVHFREKVSVKPLKAGYLGFDTIDDYSPLGESYRFEPFSCLLVATFLSVEQARLAAGKLADDRDLQEARRTAHAPQPAAEVLPVGTEFHLRAMLGSGDSPFFEGGYPDMALTLMERSGGIVHAES